MHRHEYRAGHPASLWLGGLTDEAHAKLAKVNLVATRKPPESKPPVPTVDAWIERFIEQRESLKPASRKKLERTKALLVEFFGSERFIDSINAGDAEDWRLWLRAKGLADATAATHVRNT